jgi:antibiotic biosynthesis monooxygenase (ABM) superfamily enzyme
VAWQDHAHRGGISGHLARTYPPVRRASLWTVIIRFDTIEHLYAWTQSDTRNALVKEIEPLLAEGDKTEVRTEAAFWFTPPETTCVSQSSGNSFLSRCWLSFPVPMWCRW